MTDREPIDAFERTSLKSATGNRENDTEKGTTATEVPSISNKTEVAEQVEAAVPVLGSALSFHLYWSPNDDDVGTIVKSEDKQTVEYYMRHLAKSYKTSTEIKLEPSPWIGI